MPGYDEPVPPGLRGRQPQVDVLRGQLGALGAGRGAIVLLRGPAGAGKTTLLAEAARQAADRDIQVFCGGGDPAARAVPLGAVLDALVSGRLGVPVLGWGDDICG
jgi:predicted ATPase